MPKANRSRVSLIPYRIKWKPGPSPTRLAGSSINEPWELLIYGLRPETGTTGRQPTAAPAAVEASHRWQPPGPSLEIAIKPRPLRARWCRPPRRCRLVNSRRVRAVSIHTPSRPQFHGLRTWNISSLNCLNFTRPQLRPAEGDS